MQKKNFYTAPSNNIVSSIRNNGAYSEEVKDGLIKLYTINPQVQKETHAAYSRFRKDYAVSNCKITKIDVIAPHKVYDLSLEKERKTFIETITEFVEEMDTKINDLASCDEAYLIQFVMTGDLDNYEDSSESTELCFKYAKLIHSNNGAHSQIIDELFN